MLSHVSAAIFGLCLFAIIVNTAVDGRAEIYLGAIVLGTAAITVVVLKERKPKAPPASAADEIKRWTRERDNLRRSLENARAEAAADRIAFFEPKLAEAEAMLRKLD